MFRRVETWLAAVVLGALLSYWSAWCIVGPVTNGDSQVYNLARLWVIDAGGLFWNTAYTWNTQLIMPWAFDAVHYPSVRLGFAYALPSFLCLLGSMAIVFGWATENGDTADGLRACLGFLAMPTIALQATTTKNDLVLAFCLFCWIEAMRRYVRRPTRVALVLASLALAFAAGSKLTGLLYAGVAAAMSLWILRDRPRDAAWFAGALAVLWVVNGSVEIYVNNYLQFGDWRGDPLLYRYNSNLDGWRGFLANELRYAASALDLQLVPLDVSQRIARWKYEACRSVLEALGLEGRGLMSLPWRPLGDRRLLNVMTFNRTEPGATYGIVGALLITAAPIVVAVRRRWDFPAALFVGGALAQVLVAVRLGWHPANLRYFAAAACLAWAGASLCITSRRRPVAAAALTLLVAAAAVATAMTGPRDPARLALALRDRDAVLSDFSRQMIARAAEWKRTGDVPVILTAERARVFHLYDRLGSDLVTIPALSQEKLERLDDVYRRGTYRIVAIDTDLRVPGLACDDALERYKTRICVWRRGGG